MKVNINIFSFIFIYAFDIKKNYLKKIKLQKVKMMLKYEKNAWVLGG